jgi:hypothetical protein
MVVGDSLHASNLVFVGIPVLEMALLTGFVDAVAHFEELILTPGER